MTAPINSLAPVGSAGVLPFAGAARRSFQVSMPTGPTTPRPPMSKNEVLSWLLEASEDDVRWLRCKLQEENPQFLDKFAGEHRPSKRSSNRSSTFSRAHSTIELNDSILDAVEKMPTAVLQEIEKSPEVLARESADFQIANAEAPVVQFSAPMYFCSLDEEDYILLDVIRIGNLDSKSEVSYRTKSGTAKAGEKFVHTSGRIIFSENSNIEELHIPLLKTSVFDTTTEFQVELVLDTKPVNCTIGRYLYMTRIKVIDGNCFPSNRFDKQIRSKAADEISFWSLMWEYVKFNLESPVTRRGTMKWFLVDVFKSCYLLLKLVCNLILVDKVLEKPDEDDADVKLILVALAMLLPCIIEHLLEIRKVNWKVGGSSRAKLQSFVLRKFLNYDHETRIAINSADVITAVTRDVWDVVHEGYIKILNLLGAVLDLVAVLIFQVTIPSLPMFDANFSYVGFICLGVIPCILGVFLHLRHRTTTKYIKQEVSDELEIVAQAERIVINYPLIADYGQRPFFEGRFQQRIAAFNTSRIAANLVRCNNRYFAIWIMNLSVFCYTIFGGYRIINKEAGLTLGYFLANLNILKTIGGALTDMYKLSMDIESITPAFLRIVGLINLPSDVPLRKELNRDRRDKTKVLRREVGKTLQCGWPADNLPIEVQNLNFAYDTSRATVFEMQGNIRFHQGLLTALVGPAGEGKSTLLYMLGGVVLPRPGQLFLPSHLRILHVSTQNLFFKGSLFENLTFGCMGEDGRHDDRDGRLERVITICSRLGFADDIMEYIRQGTHGEKLVWSEVVSHSQKSLLQFARAVITNPEVMCIHKPVMTYTDELSTIVLQMLREFCERKGVEQDESTRYCRRPRTCIITAAKVASVRQADQIFMVSHRTGIKHVPWDIMTNRDRIDQLLSKDDPVATNSFYRGDSANDIRISAFQEVESAKGIGMTTM